LIKFYFILLFDIIFLIFNYHIENSSNNGDWGLGIGDWG